MTTINKLNDIKNLIDARIEEDTTLDYKRDLSKNIDIAKDICAFANTEGGSLIYGVESKDRIPTAIAWILDENIEERIHNIAATAIHPKVEGVGVLRLVLAQLLARDSLRHHVAEHFGRVPRQQILDSPSRRHGAVKREADLLRHGLNHAARNVSSAARPVATAVGHVAEDAVPRPAVCTVLNLL